MGKDNVMSKSIMLFAAGVLSGYVLAKYAESEEFQKLKKDATKVIDDYFHPKYTYVEVEDDDIDFGDNCPIDDVDTDDVEKKVKDSIKSKKITIE